MQNIRLTASQSYYLSSHHIDVSCWILQDKAYPTRVVASAATGIATSEPYNCAPQTEDTITLLVDWQSKTSPKHKGTGVYTASWTAPMKAGIHSAQHWYYMGEKVCDNGLVHLIRVLNRCSRAISTSIKLAVAMTLRKMKRVSLGQIHSSMQKLLFFAYIAFTDTHQSMKYSPSESGHFDGQRGYGYISIEKFIDAARSVNASLSTPGDYDKHGLPTIANTVLTTAILNAGRISLDEKRPVGIKEVNGEWILE
jgi:D-galacturonate reductase